MVDNYKFQEGLLSVRVDTMAQECTQNIPQLYDITLTRSGTEPRMKYKTRCAVQATAPSGEPTNLPTFMIEIRPYMEFPGGRLL